MLSGSFFPLISRPTRITSNSTMLIDNIFTTTQALIALLVVCRLLTFLRAISVIPLLTRKINTQKYRKKLTCSLRAVKRAYYSKKLKEYKSNMKSTWSILNEVINSKKARVIYKRRLMLMTRKHPI